MNTDQSFTDYFFDLQSLDFYMDFVDSRVLGHSLFLKGISKSFSCIPPDFSPVL